MYLAGILVVFASWLVYKAYSECEEEDLEKIKHMCRRSGLRFDIAETVENRTLVCDCLEELFRCITKHVPNCVDTMEEQYVTFRYTPWDCHVLEFHNSESNRCGRDVIFKVRFKKEPDQTIIVKSDDDYDIRESSVSSKISPFFVTIYLISITSFLQKKILT